MTKYACHCCGQGDVDESLKKIIESIEINLQINLIINSGYRCEKHNQEVDGSPTSSHTKGLAVDISCTTSGERFRLIREILRHGINRFGVGNSFIHIDTDPEKISEMVWTY